MTTHEKALRAAMNAYEETGIAADRLPNAIAAYLSALLSDDALDLVAEMTSEDFRHEMQHLRSSSEIDRLFQAAASLIQSQAARIAELEAGLEAIAVFPNPPTVSQARARALLNEDSTHD